MSLRSAVWYFFCSFLVFISFGIYAENRNDKMVAGSDDIRALYLSIDHMSNQLKIAELERIITSTNANGIVIDFKDSNEPRLEYMQNLVARFKRINAYTIARIVTFQDSLFARRHPEIAIKTSSGTLWHSGRAVWKRYWLDPASDLVQDYNIEVAKRAIDAGFDEIQFDYIRFPTDGNMSDIRYPIFNPYQHVKADVMERFFKKIHDKLKAYAPHVVLSIDLFGEVFLYGGEKGIGQDLQVAGRYFDVISPMAYPSHYRCGEFKLHDPTAHPYEVYYATLKSGLAAMNGRKVVFRPWIQDFTIMSIYGCGPVVTYTKERVMQQIRAARDLGIRGFMLWNVRSSFTTDVFL